MNIDASGAESPGEADAERRGSEPPHSGPWQPEEPSVQRSAYRILLGRDTVVTLTQAAPLIPARRRGRKTHVSTLFRWSNSGCRGIVLPTIQCGGTRCTSIEALQWFCEMLTELSQDPGGKIETAGAPLRRSLSQRRRESEAAGKQLEKMGA
jgi:hypothetical protein